MTYTRLRELLRHQISRNVIGLYWVQVAKFLVPIVTLPYVSRVLGPGELGLVIFSQSSSIFLTLLVDWGFTPYGTRRVAIDRDDPAALARTVAHVRSAQLLLAAASVPVTVAILFAIPKFTQHPAFLAMAWLAAVSSALMPNWFFIGTERVRITAVVQLGFRVIGTVLTFVLVSRAGDAWIVMALYTATSVAMWLFSDFLVYRRVPFRLTGLRAAAAGIGESTRLFIGTVAISLFSTFNVVLLGLFVSTAQVAQFGAGERIVRTWEEVLGPVGTAVYPRLTFLQASGRPERARRLVTISIIAVGGLGALVAAVFGIFASTWLHLIFGPKFVHEGTPILRILVLLIPSNIIGYFAAIWLMSLHQDRTLLRIAVAAGLINVALGSVLTELIGPQGMAWSVVSVQCGVAVACLFAAQRVRNTPEPCPPTPPQPVASAT